MGLVLHIAPGAVPVNILNSERFHASGLLLFVNEVWRIKTLQTSVMIYILDDSLFASFYFQRAYLVVNYDVGYKLI